MNTLNIIRQGKSAARQLRVQAEAGVLGPAEFERLLKKIDDAFEEVIPTPPPVCQPNDPLARRDALRLVHGESRQ